MTAEIPLSRGLVALVDDDDAEWLSQWKWSALPGRNGRFYAIRGYGILMHRAIINPPDGYHCDHIDNNGLNNQRSNLRAVTRFQNAQNSPAKSCNVIGYKGVSRQGKKYLAQIMANRIAHRLGLFDTAEEAYAAYLKASADLHGEFARVA